MRVTGTIDRIELAEIPSKIRGKPSRVVSRLSLSIEDARGDDGAEIDTMNLVGLAFEGPAELVSRFDEGARVAIETTTPSGMHIARITPRPVD